MSDHFPYDFEFDKHAMNRAALSLSEEIGATVRAGQLELAIIEYLDMCAPRDRDFTPEFIEATRAFKARCLSEPDECPSAIWEQELSKAKQAEPTS